MADTFNPTELNKTSINNGTRYTDDNGLDPEDFNKIVDGVLFADETSKSAEEIAEQALGQSTPLYMHAIRMTISGGIHSFYLIFFSTKNTKFLKTTSDGFYTLSEKRIGFGYTKTDTRGEGDIKRPIFWLENTENTLWNVYDNPASFTEYNIKLTSENDTNYTVTKV